MINKMGIMFFIHTSFFAVCPIPSMKPSRTSQLMAMGGKLENSMKGQEG
jgi:hypothetical protein